MLLATVSQLRSFYRGDIFIYYNRDITSMYKLIKNDRTTGITGRVTLLRDTRNWFVSFGPRASQILHIRMYMDKM